MNDALADILGSIPGWQSSAAVRLSGGLTNASYLLQNGPRKAVLKINQATRTVALNSREQEARLQNIAHAAGLAAEVLAVSDRYLLSEYLAGSVWSPGDLNEPGRLAELAQSLKRIHALPLTGRTFDALEAARVYKRVLEQRTTDPVLANTHFETIRQYRSPQNLCCCHNDLVAANIISAGGLRFLDWEYACDNDPLFDLATVVAHHELEPSLADYFLDQYFDGDGKRWRPRLQGQQKLYAALAWLWEASRS